MATSKRGYVFLTFLTSLAATILSLSSLATEQWVISDTKFNGINENEQPSNVHYGLFKGVYKLHIGASTAYEIQMTCLWKHNVCAMLCGYTKEKRFDQLSRLYDGQRVETSMDGCTEVQRTFAAPKVFMPALYLDQDDRKNFLNAGCILSTIVFLCISCAFGALSTILSLLNTVQNPIQTYLGVKYLYLYNGIAAINVILVLSIWGGQFATGIIKNIAILHTLLNEMTADSTYLGSSYWLNLGALMLYVVTLIILFFRDYLLEQEPQIKMDIDDNIDDVILY